MAKQKNLLYISLTGSFPDFSAVFHKYSFQATSAHTMRKALAIIKKQSPELIVAEFVYAPTYGSQLSNFESLLAAMQSFAVNASLIALVYPDDIAHCRKVLRDCSRYVILNFPVNLQELEEHLAGQCD